VMSTKFKALKPNPLAKITNPGGFPIPNYTYRVRSTCPGNLIGYWPMAEDSGGTAQDESGNGRTGSYNNIQLGKAGIGDGRNAASFASAVNNVYSTSFRDAFNPREGTISIWCKIPDITVWSDGQARRAFSLGTGATSNILLLAKNSTTSALAAQYIANNTATNWNTGVASSSVEWEHFAMTFSRSASEVIWYYQGIARETDTSMGDFVGALNDNTAILGQATSGDGATRWSGLLAHGAIWNTALTGSQIKVLAKAY